MTNVQLLQLAQATAATVVTGNISAFEVVKASVNAFTESGNADADWPSFSQNFQRELGEYRVAAQKDVVPLAVVAAGATAAAPGKAVIPPEVLARLPKDMQARLIAANPSLAAPVAAPAPVIAAAPVAPAPTGIKPGEAAPVTSA